MVSDGECFVVACWGFLVFGGKIFWAVFLRAPMNASRSRGSIKRRRELTCIDGSSASAMRRSSVRRDTPRAVAASWIESRCCSGFVMAAACCFCRRRSQKRVLDLEKCWLAGNCLLLFWFLFGVLALEEFFLWFFGVDLVEASLSDCFEEVLESWLVVFFF